MTSPRIFAGAGFNPALDGTRLGRQVERIRKFMLGVTGWRTLREIKGSLEAIHSPATFPESSISAQLRNLKKRPHSYQLQKRRRAGVHGPGAGIWEYALRPPQQLELLEKKSAPAPQPSLPQHDDAGSEADNAARAEFFWGDASHRAGLEVSSQKEVENTSRSDAKRVEVLHSTLARIADPRLVAPAPFKTPNRKPTGSVHCRDCGLLFMSGREFMFHECPNQIARVHSRRSFKLGKNGGFSGD